MTKKKVKYVTGQWKKGIRKINGKRRFVLIRKVSKGKYQIKLLNAKRKRKYLKKPITIKISYSTITPESAREGDFAETGWESEEGEEFDNVDETVRFLRNEGVVEPSASFFHEGMWYDDEGEQNEYGETKIRSFHVKNATSKQEKAIYEKLRRR